MTSTAAWAAQDAIGPLTPTTIERGDVGAAHVKIDIHVCGVCHSDPHTGDPGYRNVVDLATLDDHVARES